MEYFCNITKITRRVSGKHLLLTPLRQNVVVCYAVLSYFMSSTLFNGKSVLDMSFKIDLIVENSSILIVYDFVDVATLSKSYNLQNSPRACKNLNLQGGHVLSWMLLLLCGNIHPSEHAERLFSKNPQRCKSWYF